MCADRSEIRNDVIIGAAFFVSRTIAMLLTISTTL